MNLKKTSQIDTAFKSNTNPLRVGIQGVRASFHDVAAKQFFLNQNIENIYCSSFFLLAKSLREMDSDVVVMAIENSIAGSILPNYSLLEKNHFKIFGELYLRIEMNLMALPGQRLEDISVIQSHPIALLQCENFFLNHPEIKILPGSDTAKCAEDIQTKNLKGYAVIGSHLAAEAYGLEILEKNIETQNQNYTRFLLIRRNEDDLLPKTGNKASIRFEMPDYPGSLGQILSIFERYSINMTKLQSVVIPERPYDYSFHVDLEWEPQCDYEEAFDLIRKKALNLIHFGVYPRGLKPLIQIERLKEK